MKPTATPTRSIAGPSSTPSSRPASPGVIQNRAGTVRNHDEHRRARREQLRNFYGLQDASPAVPAEIDASKGPFAAVAADPLDIDAPGFDAAAYYQNIISKSTLSDLMQKAAALSAEVGDLQSARHSLVYNHHNKLFSAGDAIQVLNTRTPQLISIVTSLQDSFSSISQLADSVGLPENGEIEDAQARRTERQKERASLKKIAGIPELDAVPPDVGTIDTQ